MQRFLKFAGIGILGISTIILAAWCMHRYTCVTFRLMDWTVRISFTSREPVPLVLVLHGGGGRAISTQRWTGFNDVADEHGFIVVYPNGVNHHWNDGRVDTVLDNEHIDDNSFLSQLIDHIAAEYSVDIGRVFVTGASNGGMMSLRVACEMSDKVAGIALLIANLPAETDCDTARPIPVLIMNGTADPLVPFEGGDVGIPDGRSRGVVLSSHETVEFWREVNGCAGNPEPEPLPDKDPDDGSTITLYQYTDCDAPLSYYEMEGGGHGWPGMAQYLPKRIIGPVNQDINASEVVWEFFASQ